MPNTAPTHIGRISVPRRLQHPERATTLRSVWQDKPLPTPAPPGFPTASPSANSDAPLAKRTGKQFVQETASKPRTNPATTRQKVKLYIWVDPPEKTELARFAESEGLSLSQTGRAMIVDGLRQKLRIEREVLAQPIIETTLRKFFSRMLFFLARIAFDIGVIKGLLIWLCRREAGASKEQVDTVIHQSRERARKSMTTLTPELKSLLDELKNTLQEEEAM